MLIVHLDTHPTESISWPIVFKTVRAGSQLVYHNHPKYFKTEVLCNFSLSDGENTKETQHHTSGSQGFYLLGLRWCHIVISSHSMQDNPHTEIFCSAEFPWLLFPVASQK